MSTLAQCAEEIRNANYQMVGGQLQIGRALLTARKALPHGSVTDWLETEGFLFSTRSIYNYMALARFESVVSASPAKLETLLGKKIALEAVYYLGGRRRLPDNDKAIIAAFEQIQEDPEFHLSLPAAKSICPPSECRRRRSNLATPKIGPEDETEAASTPPATGMEDFGYTRKQGVAAGTYVSSREYPTPEVSNSQAPVAGSLASTLDPDFALLQSLTRAWLTQRGPYVCTPSDVVALMSQNGIRDTRGRSLSDAKTRGASTVVGTWLRKMVGAEAEGYRLWGRQIGKTVTVYQLIPSALWHAEQRAFEDDASTTGIPQAPSAKAA